MNIKKLLITGAAAALVFGGAAGTFASNNSGTSVSNRGSIHNVSVNVANTGLNLGTSSSNREHHSNGGSVTTGDATALQSTTNVISTSASCGCATSGEHGNNAGTTVKNTGSVWNTSVNVANTGLNKGGSVNTGGAGAAQDVTNVVNTSVGSSS
jgi:hypothetical protein